MNEYTQNRYNHLFKRLIDSIDPVQTLKDIKREFVTTGEIFNSKYVIELLKSDIHNDWDKINDLLLLNPGKGEEIGIPSIKEKIKNKEFILEILANKPKKDTRFWLTSIFNEQAQTTPEYKTLKRLIENNGWFTINLGSDKDTVKVYTPELALIFSQNDFPVLNLDTKEEASIKTIDYLKTYIKGFKEGEDFFDKEYGISPNTLYGSNAEQYVRDIHLNYFHVEHNPLIQGWNYVKKMYPDIITHNNIRQFGYYSGIVSKVDAMVKKYPIIFETFDKCEHNLTSTEVEFVTEITDYFNQTLNNFQSTNPVFITSQISDVLNKYEKTPIEAIQLIIKHKGTFQPDFFENTVKSLIEKLDSFTGGLKSKQPPKSENAISRTKQIIADELQSIDKVKSWTYAFTNQTDYNTFLELLTCYFEYKPYSLPNQKIKLKKDCKTRFAKALNPIHKELSNENKKLKSDTEFFNLIRVLDHFEKLTDAEIYQAITR